MKWRHKCTFTVFRRQMSDEGSDGAVKTENVIYDFSPLGKKKQDGGDWHLKTAVFNAGFEVFLKRPDLPCSAAEN